MNESHFFFFLLYVADMHNCKIEKKLRVMCRPKVRGVEKANSGHPGLPMGCAPMSYVVWNECMKHNPGNFKWANRDRFILSAGHGSMLQYSMLHLTGYPLEISDLQQFRQWGSKTPGHPEKPLFWFLQSQVEVEAGAGW